MGKRWVTIGGSPVAKNGKKMPQKRYTRNEVEALICKAAAANGLDPATIGPVVSRLIPRGQASVAKSAAAIERERVERQAELDHSLERQRAEHTRKSEARRIEMERSAARSADVSRAATTFVGADGCESSIANSNAPVTRLDLSQPVRRSRRGLFGEIVDAEPTQPYTPRS